MVEEELANPLLSFASLLCAALAGEDHMDFLMFVLLLIFIFVAVGLGAIPGALAKRCTAVEAYGGFPGRLDSPLPSLAFSAFGILNKFQAIKRQHIN